MLLAAPGLLRAQPAWPARPVRLVVPFSPAGTTDITGRIAAEMLTPRLGQQVVVENRSGATGNLGADHHRAYPRRAAPGPGRHQREPLPGLAGCADPGGSRHAGFRGDRLVRRAGPGQAPRLIIERLGTELDAITRTPDYRARTAELGGNPPGLAPSRGSRPNGG